MKPDHRIVLSDPSKSKRRSRPMTLFHRTTAVRAASIARDGFRDGRGSYGFDDLELIGVWFSNRPLDSNEGARGDVVFTIDVPLARIKRYEVREKGKPYR